MKISEMTNDQAADALIRLAEPIGRLCDDENAVAMVDEYKANLRKPLFYVIGKIIPRLAGYLMKEHKADIYEIVSILTGWKLEEVQKKNFGETVAVIKDSYDDVLASFFTPSAGSGSGSARRSSG